jgi:hypothetical protein
MVVTVPAPRIVTGLPGLRALPRLEGKTMSTHLFDSLESRRLLSAITNIPGLVVKNPEGLPSNDRLVFNRITHLNSLRPNVTHDTAKVTLTNTRSSTLTIDSISLVDNVHFRILSGGGSNIALAPGQTRSVTVRFIGHGGSTSLLNTYISNLKIVSGSRSDWVKLAALWQKYSEQTPDAHPVYDEPALARVINTIFGFTTVVAKSSQVTSLGLRVSLGSHGARTAVGDEVMSGYWLPANSSQPVKVRMLAAWHRQNNFSSSGAPTSAASTVRYFYRGTPDSAFKLFTHNINEGQSMLQHNWNTSTAFAMRSLTPTSGKSFGFRVDSRFSDDSLNPLDFNPTTHQNFANSGHAVRFWPLKDQLGHVVANTYIMAMDYTGLSYANYDYNDNIYILSNVKPAGASSSSSVRSASVAAAAAAPAAAARSLFSNTTVNDRARNILDDDPTDALA